MKRIMDEQETLEAILAIVGLSLFFCLATIGTVIASMNADSFLYIEFNPEEDLIILVGLIFINIIFLFYLISGHPLGYQRIKVLIKCVIQTFFN